MDAHILKFLDFMAEKHKEVMRSKTKTQCQMRSSEALFAYEHLVKQINEFNEKQAEKILEAKSDK